MKNSVKLNGIVLIIFLFATILIYNCGSDTVTNTPNTPAVGTMSGTITFADTNRVYSGGLYSVSVFPSTPWPPAGPPTGADSIHFTKNGNVYTGTFQIKGLSAGTYITMAAWTKISTPPDPMPNYVLGIRGCDNNQACYFLNPGKDTLTSSVGLAGLDFKAQLDTLGAVRVP